MYCHKLFIILQKLIQNLKIIAYSKAIDGESIVKVLNAGFAMNCGTEC
jgi:hypothetical protein